MTLSLTQAENDSSMRLRLAGSGLSVDSHDRPNIGYPLNRSFSIPVTEFPEARNAYCTRGSPVLDVKVVLFPPAHLKNISIIIFQLEIMGV
jgi:hypothetical protein